MASSRQRPLTDREVRNLAQTTSVGGEPGLECVVSPGGTKAWRLLYRVAGDISGKRRSLGLGRYPTVKLAEARSRASEALKLASQGCDPKHALITKVGEQALLVQQAVSDYLDWCKGANAPGTYQDKVSLFRTHVTPAFGGRPVRSLIRKDIVGVLDGLADHPARRRTAHSYIRHFFEWALERDLVADNPSRLIRAPKTVSQRDRILSDTEIRALWANDLTMATMAKLQLLTAQRSGSIARMQWDELDLQRGEWIIPATSMKSGKPHQVPLSQPTIEILRPVSRMTGPFVFGVGSDGARPFNGKSKGMKRLRTNGAAADWRLHDLRRTAVTLAQRGGAMIEEIRALTQHKTPGVIGVYARHSYAEEKRRVADVIAKKVEVILANATGG